jgi:phosphohistidine swiveling domain-containing protein
VVPSVLVKTGACRAFQSNSLDPGFFCELLQTTRNVLPATESVFVRGSSPLNSVWCEDKIRAKATLVDIKNAVEQVFRSVSTPRSRASRVIQEISDEDASPAILIQPFIAGLSSVLSRHAVSGTPTSEANWSDNINNRLADYHSLCIAVACRSESFLGRPVILWLTTFREPLVVSVGDAMMTGCGRLIALCDLHERGVIADVELLRAIQPDILSRFDGYRIDPSVCLATAWGLPASAGQSLGRVVFREFLREDGADLPPVLFVTEVVPDDIRDIEESVAVVTSRGGITSHAAVACRGMATPCVAACEQLAINTAERVVYLGSGLPIQEHTPVLVDGSVGRVEFGSSADLVPRYAVSDKVGEVFGRLKDVLRDVSSPTRFRTLSMDDQMHIARLKNRLKGLNSLP